MRFLPQEIIRAKRDGERLRREAIADLVAGIGEGGVADAQIAAFAMAVFLRGMEPGETVALTEAMRDSGEVLDWRDIGRPVIDKHSTGGVGDNVSLMLAPIVAACGAAVPMISGRGLGHTGGTLDKLEAIPGYRVTPDDVRLRAVVRAVGCAIVGQTARLAPADGRIYAVRDTTATVESVPLIVASILSKKLAAGLGGLVLDVKTGSGAFMPEIDDARALMRALVEVAVGAGLPTTALLTAMDEPLASAAGNAAEIRNAVRFLDGTQRDPRLLAVTLALAGEMLVLASLAPDPDAGERLALAALDDGRALERFARMVAGLGGPADFVERMDAHLPRAPVSRPATALADGVVAAIETRDLGLAVVRLGGGRTRPGDPVDPAVGLTEIAAIGTQVRAGDPLAVVHARDEGSAAAAVAVVRAAMQVGNAAPMRQAVIERFG
ncbi:thymidine phosphorylase [Aureimonas pseudogalii]|uniref:Thymidine phosphorylase n=1 Tax=Aureimonas pseudogalii TaxID=1744844 RepID=A0A7W6EGN5_9HYPH|nr:thymidine phosphorylase [Aureimonas pseudogalii]MBB3998430.1 thymidine phosphorylase [Aureimonas pseudogalii]